MIAPAPRLHATGLHARRAGVPVLRGVDLDLRPGRLLAVLGPNGAGKSTLLLALSGLVRLDGGRVELNGRRIDGLAAERIARLGVAHIPQGRRLFGELTVLENLAMSRFACRRGVEPHPAEAVLSRLGGLSRHSDTPAGLLSGGEQQLVAVARGLVPRPQVVLCDEPTAALSPGARRRVLSELRRVADEGAAVAVV